MLRSLTMHCMAQALGELLEQGAPAFDAAVPILSQLETRKNWVFKTDSATWPANSDALSDFGVIWPWVCRSAVPDKGVSRYSGQTHAVAARFSWKTRRSKL